MTAAAVAAAIAVTACGGSSSNNSTKTSAAAGSGGSSASSGKTYVIGTSADFPPFSSPAADNPNDIVGFEPDMMKTLMGHLGWKYKWGRSDFNGLIPAVQSGRMDMVVSDVYDTAARRKVVDFIDYLQTGLSVMVRASDAAQTTSFMAVCGKPMGILTGASTELSFAQLASKQCTKAGKAAIQIKSYPEVAQEVPALQHGVLYAILEDTITLGLIQKAKHDAVKVVFDDPPARTNLGLVVKKGSSLEPKLQAAMKWYFSTPDYKANVKKWGFPPSSILKGS